MLSQTHDVVYQGISIDLSTSANYGNVYDAQYREIQYFQKNELVRSREVLDDDALFGYS